jgi:hypothetical protein
MTISRLMIPPAGVVISYVWVWWRDRRRTNRLAREEFDRD